MLRNFLKIAVRNFKKFKIYSMVNLLGLSLGLMVGIFTLFFVIDEFGFDTFHEKSDRIYKIVTRAGQGFMETNGQPAANNLKAQYPEVEAILYTRITHPSMMVTQDNQKYSHDIFYASEDFFNIFTFPLIEGNPNTALKDPSSIVITEEMKLRYFGQQIALGKTLTLRDSIVFTVTGVVANPPRQSHIQFDMLISFEYLVHNSENVSLTEGWGNFNVRNYLLLKKGAEFEAFESKSKELYRQEIGEFMKEMGVDFEVAYIPLRDIYLRSTVHNGFGPKGSLAQIKLVAVVGAFVIFLACINFINISTARSIYRAKEVGLRKISGSGRGALIGQFIAESFFLTVSAFIVAVLMVELLMPFFNQLMGREYSVFTLFDAKVIGALAGLLVIVTLLSGYYPALMLSGFKPLEVLRGSVQSGRKGINLRRFLVVFQFIVTAALITGTLVVAKQINYMRNQNLGFDKEQILVLDGTNLPPSANVQGFQNDLKSMADIKNVSYNNALPGKPGFQGQWAYPEEISENTQVDTEYMAVDENYLETLGLELIAGRNFDLNSPVDLKEGLIINEVTVNEMGWETPENAIGKSIVSPSKTPEGIVIGVVKDYHGLGLRHRIWPMVMDFNAEQYGRYLAVRFETGNTTELLENVQSNWQKSFVDTPFDYFFLDEEFDKQYRSEEQLMAVFIMFASIGIVIACIGLLGLISFMVVTRHKEIGIRKVMGANVWNITTLLSREFLLLVLLADIIVIPIVLYFGREWIAGFAFHTEISNTLFIINALITLIIAGLTVSFQTIRAALMNPANSIRNE